MWQEQINTADSKANLVLGLLKNTFSSWSYEIVLIIYPIFVRPHLEFASSVWNRRRILLKNTRKCPVQSNPHERITPPALRKKTPKTRCDWPYENKTRKRRFHTDLQDCAWSRQGKLLQMVMDGAYSQNIPLFITFVDFKKAFDSIDRSMMFAILRHYGIPDKIVSAIRVLFDQSTCQVYLRGQV